MEFAALDTMAMRLGRSVFGTSCTVWPMTRLTHDMPAEMDGSREPMTLLGIRAEWPERVEAGDNGMGRMSGTFRIGFAAQRCLVTFAMADMTWTPRAGDELTFVDRGGLRYRLSEPQPDGLSGIRYVLSEAAS